MKARVGVSGKVVYVGDPWRFVVTNGVASVASFESLAEAKDYADEMARDCGRKFTVIDTRGKNE